MTGSGGGGSEKSSRPRLSMLGEQNRIACLALLGMEFLLEKWREVLGFVASRGGRNK
jgi:hypothetical protein